MNDTFTSDKGCKRRTVKERTCPYHEWENWENYKRKAKQRDSSRFHRVWSGKATTSYVNTKKLAVELSLCVTFIIVDYVQFVGWRGEKERGTCVWEFQSNTAYKHVSIFHWVHRLTNVHASSSVNSQGKESTFTAGSSSAMLAYSW